MKKFLICNLVIVVAACAVKDVISMEGRFSRPLPFRHSVKNNSELVKKAPSKPKEARFFMRDRVISCNPRIEIDLTRYNPEIDGWETVGITLDNPRGMEDNYKVVEFYKGPLPFVQPAAPKAQQRAWRISRKNHTPSAVDVNPYSAAVKQGYIKSIQIKDARGVTHSIDAETIERINARLDEVKYGPLRLEVVRNDPMGYGPFASYRIIISEEEL